MRKKNDILLKSAFEEAFPDLLRFFFKEADTLFDIDKGFEFMDKELSELDDEMAAQYRHVVARHPDPALIRERQRAWLTERNRCAGAPTCLKRLYGARIEELEGNATAFRQDTGLKFEHVDRRPEPSSAPPKTEAERKARQRASRVGG